MEGGKGLQRDAAKHKSDGSWFTDVMRQNTSRMDQNQLQMNRNWAAAMLGPSGGLKGGIARAKKLSPERRAAIARLTVPARWARRIDATSQ